MLAPLAYILRMRTGPLRNLGACISPDNAWMFLQEGNFAIYEG